MSYLHNSANKTQKSQEKYDILNISVAFMSLFIFFYRFILVAVPMFKEAYSAGNLRDMALAMTMLV